MRESEGASEGWVLSLLSLREGVLGMSYPFIGMRGILPEGEEWDAHRVEKLLRDGHDIYIDGDDLNSTQVVRFQHDKFQVSQTDIDNPVYESESFLEAAVWLAFMGRSFI